MAADADPREDELALPDDIDAKVLVLRLARYFVTRRRPGVRPPSWYLERRLTGR